MNYFKYIFFLSFFFCYFTKAQTDLQTLDDKAEGLLRTYPDSAISVLNAELTLAKTKGDSQFVVKATRKLGYVNYFLANYDKSLGFYLEALKLAEKYRLNDELLMIYNLLGTEYKKINKANEAKGWFRKGLIHASELKNEDAVAGFNNDLGLVFEIEQQNDSAHNSFVKALDLYRKGKNVTGESYSLDYLSELESNRGNYSTAIDYALQALKIRETLNDKNVLAIALNNTGEIYFAWGKLKEAITYFEKSLILSKEIKYRDLSAHTAKKLYESFKGTSDINNALVYFELSASIRDSISSETNLKNLNELDAKYQNEKKQMQIDKLHSENKLKAEKIRQQYYVISLVVALLAVLAISVILVIRNSRKIKEAYTVINLQKEHAEEQKNLIADKQKEILDSIHYAKRIQSALLPSERSVEKAMKRSTYKNS